MMDFEDLVLLDVKGELELDNGDTVVCSSEHTEILKTDIRRWLAELNSLKRDVEIQMTAQKARVSERQVEYIEKNNTLEWLRYKSKEDTHRIGALRFMASVESKILYVKSLRSNAKLVASE